jgi:hypothetical protein
MTGLTSPERESTTVRKGKVRQRVDEGTAKGIRGETCGGRRSYHQS